MRDWLEMELETIIQELKSDQRNKAQRTTNVDRDYSPSSSINQQPKTNFVQLDTLIQEKVAFLAEIINHKRVAKNVSLKRLLELCEQIRNESKIRSTLNQGLYRSMIDLLESYNTYHGITCRIAIQLLMGPLSLIKLPNHWAYLENEIWENVLTTNHMDYKLRLHGPENPLSLNMS